MAGRMARGADWSPSGKAGMQKVDVFPIAKARGLH